MQYYDFKLTEEKDRFAEDLCSILDIFEEGYPEEKLSQSSQRSICKFLANLGPDETIDAMYIALYQMDDPISTFKYFCGICHNRIRKNNSILEAK